MRIDTQIFEPSDLFTLGILVFMEIFLSADNAIVLGLLTHKLPEKLRAKALYIGVFSAFILRFVAIFTVSFFIQHPFLQWLGGMYLIYLCIQYFAKKRTKDRITPKPSTSFWKTVFWVEIFDCAFALDSIIAALAFLSATTEQKTYPSKIWIVYVGGILGLLSIRWAAKFFSRMIHKFPRLETSAYAMVGLIGLKLGIQSIFHSLPSWITPLYWVCLSFCIFLGFTKKVRT